MNSLQIEKKESRISQWKSQGWTGMYTLVSHLCLRNSLKIAIRICQFSQYLGTKLDMLFEMTNSVEIVIILGKQLFHP